MSIITKRRKKAKIPKFRETKILFEYFWARVLEKLLSYLKAAPSNLSICKIL